MKLKSVSYSLATAVLLTATVQAQTFPSKPITIVVAYPPGGASDVMTRVVAEKLEARTGKPVIVDNRPGGNTIIATSYVQKATPDGYTLYMTTADFSYYPFTTPSVARYDPIKDFTPVAGLTSMLFVLVANPQLPYKSTAELLAFAKANPGKINVATNGVGSSDHLGGALFAHRAGIKLNFVPYKGGPQALTDVIGGTADIRFDAMPSSRQFIESGKLAPLTVFSATRHAAFPAIPAASETLKGAEFGNFFGIIGPKGIPEPVLQKLSQELAAIMAMPEVIARASAMGLDVNFRKPDEFSADLQKAATTMSTLLKETGLKIE